MNMSASDYDIGLNYLSSVDQSATETWPFYFKEYINNPDIVPADIRNEFDEQLISTIALSPEILQNPPTFFSLMNKSIRARFVMFASPESMASFLQGDNIFHWPDDERESRENQLQNDCEDEICIFRGKIWQVLTKAVHDKVRLYFGETNDEYLWTSVYSEQNLNELLEYINKLLSYHQKYIEHPFRGEEIHPDDLLYLLDNRYCEFDPLDYTEENILLEESDTTPDSSKAEHDWLFTK
ncbi:hypothetical protein [Enterobacter ludwigii]|uniref:hypothetical protein n=1 Tax=Enterobacter ludwigii TaxID=299767 RepID=UPI0039764C34